MCRKFQHNFDTLSWNKKGVTSFKRQSLDVKQFADCLCNNLDLVLYYPMTDFIFSKQNSKQNLVKTGLFRENLQTKIQLVADEVSNEY